MSILEVKNIHKDFGRTKVLKDINFTLEMKQYQKNSTWIL